MNENKKKKKYKCPHCKKPFDTLDELAEHKGGCKRKKKAGKRPEKKQEIIRNEKGQFVKGHSGNPTGEGAGRPKGSVSIITKVKQILRENPEMLEEIAMDLLQSKRLRRELIRQIDGMPKQKMDLTSQGEKITGFEYVKPKDEKDKG